MKITGKKVLLFDLDGTLTDPAQGITNSFVHAFEVMGKQVPSYQVLCNFIGPPLKDSFRSQGFTEAEVDAAVLHYRQYYRETGIFENRVFDGIPELLEKLQSAGYRIFMATSKPEEFAVRIAERFGITRYFERICGASTDETRTRKAEVIEYCLAGAGLTAADKDTVLMIGDRHHDVDGAKEQGIECMGVLFGYGSRQELEGAGAAWIAATVSDIADYLLCDMIGQN